MKLCVTCRKPAPNHVICSGCVERAESVMFAVTPWTPFEKATIHPDVAAEGFDQCWKNSRYTVLVRYTKDNYDQDLVHLSIKRNDKNPMHDWRDMQRIKNEILGEEEEAMELYPAESRLIDTANQYHLWCFTGQRAPFGYNSVRLVMEDVGSTGGKQRPFEKKPGDLTTEEEYQEKLNEHRRNNITKIGYREQIRALLDKASGDEGYCQNPYRYVSNPKKCEAYKPDKPEEWCGPCLARLLKKLATEAGIL